MTTETFCTCHRPADHELEALSLELALAQAAMREGDLTHARHHVASALGLVPTDGRAHAALEELAELVDLTPLPDTGWYGEYAMIALALYRAGRPADALRVMADVATSMPHLGYEHILTRWVAEGGDGIDAAASDRIGNLLLRVGENTIGIHRMWPGERALLAPYARLAEVYSAVEPRASMRAAASGLLRRVGRAEQALAVVDGVDGSLARLQEGLALRAQGDGDGACAAFSAAEALDPAAAYTAERARSLFVAHRDDEVLELLGGARASDDPEIAQLRDAAARRDAGDTDARISALDALRRERRLLALDAPGDATANFFAQPRKTHGARLTLAVDGWESPTNRMLIALAEGHGDVRRVAYEMRFEDAPRPVMARVRGNFSAWIERDGVVVPSVPAPRGDFPAALAQIARATGPAHAVVDAMLYGASELVAQRRIGAASLLAAIVHPPRGVAVDGEHLPTRVFRYQIACALALASLPARAGISALESLVFGPVDWVSAAAIVALGECTRRDAAVAAAGRSLLIAAVDDLLPFSTDPRFSALHAAFDQLPAVPARVGEALRTWHRERGEE